MENKKEYYWKGKIRELSPNWRGGRRINDRGYIFILVMSPHARADRDGYVKEHILVAEKAFGGPLPLGSVVHHINGIKGDNRPDNLILCENESYHILLHKRKRSYDACGNAGWLRCLFCKVYDDPKDMHIKKSGNKSGQAYHRSCNNADRIRRQKRF